MLYFNYFRVHIKKRNIKSNPFKNSHNSLPTSLILSLNISQITSSSSQMKTKKEESHFTQFYCPPGDIFTTRMGLRFRGVPDDQVKESLRKKGKGQTKQKKPTDFILILRDKSETNGGKTMKCVCAGSRPPCCVSACLLSAVCFNIWQKTHWRGQTWRFFHRGYRALTAGSDGIRLTVLSSHRSSCFPLTSSVCLYEIHWIRKCSLFDSVIFFFIHSFS